MKAVKLVIALAISGAVLAFGSPWGFSRSE